MEQNEWEVGIKSLFNKLTGQADVSWEFLKSAHPQDFCSWWDCLEFLVRAKDRREVRIGPKVDLDTVGTAFLLGINRADKVIVLRNGQASEAELSDPGITCIEVGGSGRTTENNWDHHDPDGPKESATKQGANEAVKFLTTHQQESVAKLKLVDYIETLDVLGPQALPEYGQVEFPTFSDIFAGMCLITRDPVEQFQKGVEIISQIVMGNYQSFFGTIRGFEKYSDAKAKNNRQIAEAVQLAKWSTTKAGRKLGYLETDFFGTPGALYGKGAEIVVAFAPRFGNPPVPKFTIGGNGIRVDAALASLNALEPGWGGPPTGTIIGSPREGSKLSLEQVVSVVKEVL
ncbi:MAG: hypothetical protein PHF50_00755 [Patescibacteria group bacterium]|nr:hypothetical protein [Patescibacteria group bacterium]